MKLTGLHKYFIKVSIKGGSKTGRQTSGAGLIHQMIKLNYYYLTQK